MFVLSTNTGVTSELSALNIMFLFYLDVLKVKWAHVISVIKFVNNKKIAWDDGWFCLTSREVFMGNLNIVVQQWESVLLVIGHSWKH